jgi:hypothetical protein
MERAGLTMAPQTALGGGETGDPPANKGFAETSFGR